MAVEAARHPADSKMPPGCSRMGRALATARLPGSDGMTKEGKSVASVCRRKKEGNYAAMSAMPGANFTGVGRSFPDSLSIFPFCLFYPLA